MPFDRRPTSRASRARSLAPILRNSRTALANLRGRSLTTTDLAALPDAPNATFVALAGLSLRPASFIALPERANGPALRRDSSSGSAAGCSTGVPSTGSSMTTRAVLAVIELLASGFFVQKGRRMLVRPSPCRPKTNMRAWAREPASVKAIRGLADNWPAPLTVLGGGVRWPSSRIGRGLSTHLL